MEHSASTSTTASHLLDWITGSNAERWPKTDTSISKPYAWWAAATG